MREPHYPGGLEEENKTATLIPKGVISTGAPD